jgi:hypothetical protein
MGQVPSDIVIDVLSPYLGPHTAKTALRTFAQRTLQMAPESLTLTDLLKVIEALKPTLGGLLGSAKADEIVRQLDVELKR